MKSLTLIFLFFVMLSNMRPPATVYVCNSDNAKKYHLRAKCKGLSTCQYKILTITLDKAKSQGKTLCGWEK